MKKLLSLTLTFILITLTATFLTACLPAERPSNNQQNSTTELIDAKANATESLEAYVNANDYRVEQQEELATAIASGKEAIDKALDLAGVENALASVHAYSTPSFFARR